MLRAMLVLGMQRIFLSQQLIEQIDLEINRGELASVTMLIRVIFDPT